MIARNAELPVHPNSDTLALYSAGDLPFITRIRVGRHIGRCGDCEQQVLLFRSAVAELKREARAETLTGFEAIADWSMFEREMLGNIAVGVSAARCIEKVGRRRHLLTKLAFGAGFAALFIGGWVSHVSREQTDRLLTTLSQSFSFDQSPARTTFLRSTPGGIAVRAQGATLTIMHPPSAAISVSSPTIVAARYVDEDTGQVTITSVYGQ